MEVWLDSSGRRDREFRPYISQEETSRSVYLYDPNGRGFNYGLYESAQPTCGSWIDIYDQFPSKIPSQIADKTGRLHAVRPNYWRHGYKYDPLLNHTRPS